MQVKDRIKCLFYVFVCCGNVRDKLTVDFSVQMIVEEVWGNDLYVWNQTLFMYYVCWYMVGNRLDSVTFSSQFPLERANCMPK